MLKQKHIVMELKKNKIILIIVIFNLLGCNSDFNFAPIQDYESNILHCNNFSDPSKNIAIEFVNNLLHFTTSDSLIISMSDSYVNDLNSTFIIFKGLFNKNISGNINKELLDKKLYYNLAFKKKGIWYSQFKIEKNIMIDKNILALSIIFFNHENQIIDYCITSPYLGYKYTSQ
jgi:hypothetical protein